MVKISIVCGAVIAVHCQMLKKFASEFEINFLILQNVINILIDHGMRK